MNTLKGKVESSQYLYVILSELLIEILQSLKNIMKNWKFIAAVGINLVFILNKQLIFCAEGAIICCIFVLLWHLSELQVDW